MTPITGVVIEYAGDVGEMNTRALTSAALAGVLQPQLGTVNMVSAPIVAQGTRHQGRRSAAERSAAPTRPISA